jgi:GT2 family glycosyltransferase
MNISIIIVNFNTLSLTTQCINSVLDKTTSELKFEIIVVDNASSDGSQEALSKIENIKLIISPENIGFGRANNLGAKQASGDFLFLLNSDTILIEDSISILFQFFIKNEKILQIGNLGCTLIGTDLIPNASAYRFTKIKNVIATNYGLNFFISSKYKSLYTFENEVTEVDYVIGADLMVRRNIFEKVNGFDEDFFMYFEEQDMQKRIINLGLKSFIINTTEIIHIGSGSTDVNKLNNNKRIMIQKSINLYLKKNEPKMYYIYLPFNFIYSLLRFLNFNYSIKENLKLFKETF